LFRARMAARLTSPRFMRDRDRLYYLYLVASRCQCRPSDLVGLQGMSAYVFDCGAAEEAAFREGGVQIPVDTNVIEW